VSAPVDTIAPATTDTFLLVDVDFGLAFVFSFAMRARPFPTQTIKRRSFAHPGISANATFGLKTPRLSRSLLGDAD